MIRASHSKKFSSLAGPAEHTQTHTQRVFILRLGVMTDRQVR